MRTLRTLLKTLLALVVLFVLGGLAFVYSGVYNVAATDEHWPLTRWLVHAGKERSIALRADDIRAPEIGGRERILAGAAAYDRMCAHCHTPPGGEDTPVAQGLYPAPPDMSHAAAEFSAAEIFWVIKHGIKASGMPAWGPTHSDEELWPIVAFVQRLPELDAEAYAQMVREAEEQGAGHHHAGGESARAGTPEREAEEPEPGVEEHAHDH